MPLPLDSSSVIEFHGGSYVEVKLSNNVAKTFAYEIWFLPTTSDGSCLVFCFQTRIGDPYFPWKSEDFRNRREELATKFSVVTSSNSDRFQNYFTGVFNSKVIIEGSTT